MKANDIRYLIGSSPIWLGSPALLINAFLVSRPVGDSWILDGVIPGFLVLLTTMLVAWWVSGPKTVVPQAAALGALSMMPSVKYTGLFDPFDSAGHLAVAQAIISSSHIPTSGVYSAFYGPTPGMHLALAAISLLSGIAPVQVFALTLGILTFVISILMIRIAVSLTGASYRLSIGAVLVTVPVFVWVVGESFALILFASFWFAVFGIKRNQGRFVVFTIISLALVFTHFVTFFMIYTIIAALTLVSFLRRSSKIALGMEFVLMSVIFIGWIVYVGPYYVTFGLQSFEQAQGGIPVGYANLAIQERVQNFLANNPRVLIGGTCLILALTIPILRWRRRLWPYDWKVLVAMATPLMSGLAFLTSGLAAFLRVLPYSALAWPVLITIFVGVMMKGRQVRTRTFLKLVALFVIAASLVTAYNLQPLYPLVNGHPLASDVLVNSQYQISAISYLGQTFHGSLATDGLALNQIAAFAPGLYQRTEFYQIPAPFASSLAGRCTAFEYQSGSISAPLTAYEYSVSHALLTQGQYMIVYTNGGSYVGLC